jgi:hypothetical protein
VVEREVKTVGPSQMPGTKTIVGFAFSAIVCDEEDMNGGLMKSL